MDSIKVNTTRRDQTIHHVVLNEGQLKALIVEAVAKAAGVTVDRKSVLVDRLYLSSQMGSAGSEHSATCTIIVDHQALAADPAARVPSS